MESTAVQAAPPPIGSPEFYRDPYPTYRDFLQSGTRVVRLNPTLVAVTHHRDCLDTLRNPGLSAKRYFRQLAHFNEDERRQLSAWTSSSQNMMFFMDAPEHTRLRKLLQRAFSPEAMAALLPRMEAVLRDVLDVVPAGVEIDFMEHVAHRFPALIIGEILGVSRDMWERLMAWSDTFIEYFAMLQPSLELALRANQATLEMSDYFRELAREKKLRPAGDLISEMVNTEEDGDALNSEELLAQCVLLLVAGHETTRNLLGNGLLALLRHPEEMERLRQDPQLTRSAIEELLRFDGPVQGTSRIATTDLEICGEQVRAGESLLTLIGCANRDPSQFPEPDRLDLARKNNSHLDFGGGAHACLGMHLARLEAQIAFPALLQRYPRIELREDEPSFNHLLTLRGLKRLNVVLHAN
jgi:cytochrome P450